MVPTEIRSRVWAAYSLGQESGDASVTRGYLGVMKEAIEAVAKAEGRR